MEPRAEHLLEFARGAPLPLGRRTAVMGIVNVTPDSFSDGGRFRGPEEAVEAGLRMVEAGADLLDVGGESTRPGAVEVGVLEEAERVLPVIEGLRRAGSPRISIDTTRSAVARQALEAGADLVNDVSALADPGMAEVLARHRVPVVLMHMRGNPRTMQADTRYADVVAEVRDFLVERARWAVAAGVPDGKILLDPGIGFGKSVAGNLELLARLGELGRTGRPTLVGASRKSFIGAVLDAPVGQRLEGSLAVAALASAGGAHVIRAHDVAETVKVVRMVDAVREVAGRDTRRVDPREPVTGSR